MTDTELLVQIREGDGEAFVVLIERYRDMLWRNAQYYAANKHDADEIVQETIFRAYVSIHKLREPERFAAWLRSILFHYALALLKKKKRVVVSEKAVQHHIQSENILYDERLYIQEALGKLEDKYRRVIVLKYFQDFTLQQIADMLRCPLGTVKTRVHHALRLLQQSLAEPKESKVERKLYAMKQHLKNKALSLFPIPDFYELFIEDYAEEAQGGRAVFSWKNPADEEEYIWIELDADEKLIDFTRSIRRSTTGSSLSIEQLKQEGLRFVEEHYPRAAHTFVAEPIKEQGDTYRFSYVQKAMDLPLSMTGFTVGVERDGSIQSFHYYGYAERVIQPQVLADKEEVKRQYLEQLEITLTIESIIEEIYEPADGKVHLVYEFAPLPAYPAEHKKLKAHVYEEGKTDEYMPLPPMAASEIAKRESASVETLIGLTPAYRKIRESDLGEALGIVWRANEAREIPDRSIDSFFKERTENTVKARVDKETGHLHSFIWFEKRTGELSLSDEECRKKALQFLYTLFPQAGAFFQLLKRAEETRQEETCVLFTFRIVHAGVPLRSGFASISVNRTNGYIERYIGPDIEPQQLRSVNAVPKISREQAMELFHSAFDLKLQWSKEYEENGESYYQLVYAPDFPSLPGELRFIEAHTGQMIFTKY
ncbi:sigma-70 family RNA polymerase sigma factor [Aneurinibacillus aneurinilyticus]|uniref:Sigma-70 family RNA polymerase sigma factor n=1 Tax=Aneurinibacillus aneurinilyticus TaxID=1391 RepID=A0A848CZ78_ANEAE|nr:sigma-70 family RNA polymerase sigma factor [Aneurinibacillus aneurinilyticus]NME98756.1 sigma-70 family RNA polymerase sigma factor [Aneurinibacillus aneurinilyticus]